MADASPVQAPAPSGDDPAVLELASLYCEYGQRAAEEIELEARPGAARMREQLKAIRERA